MRAFLRGMFCLFFGISSAVLAQDAVLKPFVLGSKGPGEVAAKVLGVIEQDLPADGAVVARAVERTGQQQFAERLPSWLDRVGSAGTLLLTLAGFLDRVVHVAGHARAAQQPGQRLGGRRVADQFQRQEHADGHRG